MSNSKAWGKLDTEVTIVGSNASFDIDEMGAYALKKVYTPIYDFGDGSNNSVIKGYNSTLKAWSKSECTLVSVPQNSYKYSYGNLDYIYTSDSFTLSTTKLYERVVGRGENELLFTTPIIADGNTMYIYGAENGGGTCGASIGKCLVKVNDTYYHFNELIDLGYIEPLVVIPHAWSSNHCYSDVLKILYSDEQTVTANWVTTHVYFIPKKDVVLQGIKVTSNIGWSVIDGLRIYSVDDKIFCLGLNE